MEEDDVYIKVLDKDEGDVVFEGRVSTDVAPHEIVYLGCFLERGWNGIRNKATNKFVGSFKGLHNANLVAASSSYVDFSGVLYVDVDHGVLKKSKSVPLRECVMMSVWRLSHEECEKAFKCETLEELEIHQCKLKLISNEIGKMKKLKKLELRNLPEFKSIPEEIGELTNLRELWIDRCAIESLPKRLKELKLSRSIRLVSLDLQLHAEDVIVLSKLEHLKIKYCDKVFTHSFAKAFWEMIKSTTDLGSLNLNWRDHNREMVVAALEENGSIVDGGEYAESYAQFFKRNKANHERALASAVCMLAIRRWRDALNGVPKEIVKMIAALLWTTKCDVKAWSDK